MSFLAKIGTVEVEVEEIPRSGGRPYLPVEPSGIGVLHTTECGDLVGALAAFRAGLDPPHFLVGEGRIVQCRPLGSRAGALRSNHGDSPNRYAQVQIEMVGFSQERVWSPPAPTLDGAVLVMAFCARHLGLPLQRPDEAWLDDNSDVPMPWAADNARRVRAAAGLWPSAKGWWTHLEVPWQSPSWHWDCGALDRHGMLIAARALVASSAV